MDNLNHTPPQTKSTRPSLRKRIYEGLPAKGTSLRTQIRMLVFSDNSPAQIALGAAIGIFLALSPFLGIHTIAALGLALVFRASRPAAVLGTFINNPVTMTFIYLLEIKLGSYVLGYSLTMPEGIWKDFVELFSLGRQAVLSIMTGFIILGLLSAIAVYLLTLGAVLYMRKARARKQET
jgi:uncharacterized protein (DUF2062 family)